MDWAKRITPPLNVNYIISNIDQSAHMGTKGIKQ